MLKTRLLIALLFFSVIKIYAQEINFPPELLWWIYEVKKANPNIEINKFKFGGKDTRKFGVDNYYQGSLVYPVFMRWNYSGYNVAYYSYHNATLTKQKSGKYGVGDFDDVGHLYIADRNKKVYFMDSFGIMTGLNAYYWLTDTVLIAVGLSIKVDEPYDVDLFIIEYKIVNSNKTVEIRYFEYENALKNEDRFSLKLDWYEQRNDYFEKK